jgi:hypothetical protein
VLNTIVSGVQRVDFINDNVGSEAALRLGAFDFCSIKAGQARSTCM